MDATTLAAKLAALTDKQIAARLAAWAPDATSAYLAALRQEWKRRTSARKFGMGD